MQQRGEREGRKGMHPGDRLGLTDLRVIDRLLPGLLPRGALRGEVHLGAVRIESVLHLRGEGVEHVEKLPSLGVVVKVPVPSGSDRTADRVEGPVESLRHTLVREFESRQKLYEIGERKRMHPIGARVLSGPLLDGLVGDGHVHHEPLLLLRQVEKQVGEILVPFPLGDGGVFLDKIDKVLDALHVGVRENRVLGRPVIDERVSLYLVRQWKSAEPVHGNLFSFVVWHIVFFFIELSVFRRRLRLCWRLGTGRFGFRCIHGDGRLHLSLFSVDFPGDIRIPFLSQRFCGFRQLQPDRPAAVVRNGEHYFPMDIFVRIQPGGVKDRSDGRNAKRGQPQGRHDVLSRPEPSPVESGHHKICELPVHGFRCHVSVCHLR